MGAGKHVNEVEFRETREIVLRVAARIGLPCTYSRSDFAADDKALRESVRRKRRLREAFEARYKFMFGDMAWLAEQERWQRGRYFGGRKTETEAVA
ncbi:MAG TPA: hypothetical protein VNY51_09345 [Candidatus Dormibacteraeota bacterium]|jgi:hypothetical protein|nr:hypothetical protein [Candidatus Dormibacteraeota bacterium]